MVAMAMNVWPSHATFCTTTVAAEMALDGANFLVAPQETDWVLEKGLQPRSLKGPWIWP
jgi:hypothetical protein